MKYILLLVLSSLLPVIVCAAEYQCKVDQKFDRGLVYSADQLQKWQFSLAIKDNGSNASLSRCSFSPSEQVITCDHYDVDKIIFDEHVNIKKYYVFNSQFDVQLFPNLTILENNGRGSISFGKCTLVAP